MIELGFPERSWARDWLRVVYTSRGLAPPRSPRPWQTVNHNGQAQAGQTGLPKGERQRYGFCCNCWEVKEAGRSTLKSRVRFRKRAEAFGTRRSRMQPQTQSLRNGVLGGAQGQGQHKAQAMKLDHHRTGKDIQIAGEAQCLIRITWGPHSKPASWRAPLRSTESQSQRRNLHFFTKDPTWFSCLLQFA